jgi:high affinity Mn2+ porin
VTRALIRAASLCPSSVRKISRYGRPVVNPSRFRHLLAVAARIPGFEQMNRHRGMEPRNGWGEEVQRVRHLSDLRRASCPLTIFLACLATPALAEPTAKSNELAELPYYNWTGMYVGGSFGWGGGDTRNTLCDPNPATASNSFGSLYGGVQVGYNYVLPNHILLGVEADISFPSFLGTDDVVSTRATTQGQVAERVDFISTLRGRFGYALDRWLIYGTGGIAWSRSRFTETPGLLGGEDKLRQYLVGWALGGGAEIVIAPSWTGRLEYIYDRLDPGSVTFQSGTRFASSTDEQTVRVGLNRQLGVTDPPTDDVIPASALSRNWNVHGQFTLVEQGYPNFHSPYEGPQSLPGEHEIRDTFSATAFVGWRPWAGTEVYVDPELAQGQGLGSTLGLAAFPNGEAQKASFPVPRFNVARFFVRQTIGLGGEQETIEDGPNRLAATQDFSRITLTAGKFAVTDFFDGNGYAHDPRADFLNWNLYCCGSYDWTMDKVSYTWGAFAELNQKYWAVRTGYFLVPVVSNDNRYDAHVFARGEYIAELELRYSLFSLPGKLRLMPWVNIADAGSYAEALAEPPSLPNYPDITLTRRVRSDYGIVVNAEQEITKDLGVFSRVTWNAGQTEIIGWTDCNESVSFGAVLKGTSWGRENDRVGVGAVVEGLSPEARAYFAAGGLGIVIGDGRLNYRPETAIESYYAYSLNKWTTLTGDYQFIANPAYNADRGPVSIFAARLHAEF